MRLGSLILTAAAAAQAQVVPGQAAPLPWVEAISPPWDLLAEGAAASPPSPPAPPADASLRVTLRVDGSLRVVDPRGTLRASLGLPGRIIRAWRDGGTPLSLPGPWRFPGRTPLLQGRVERLLGGADPRAGLAGLAWFLDDGERCLTVVHPATGGALHLRLPEGEAFDLAFFPDHLELRDGSPGGPRVSARRWSLPWILLVPYLGRLIPGAPPARGTALVPFPRE